MKRIRRTLLQHTSVEFNTILMFRTHFPQKYYAIMKVIQGGLLKK